MPRAIAQIPFQPHITTVTPWSMLESVGSKLMANNVAQSADSARTSTVWPSANLAIFIPFFLPIRMTLQNLFWTNGTVISGNVDCGIYTADGVRIASTGSTAQTGTSTGQFVSVTPVSFGPGLYYLSLSVDNVTATIGGGTNGNLALMKTVGLAEAASSFPLPANVTLATISNDFVPLCGASFEPTV